MPYASSSTPRWWEYVRDGRVFCGPRDDGHHIPARFEIPEFGFVQCQAPAIPQPLLDLKRLLDARMMGEADRLERELRGRGVDVPDRRGLVELVRTAPKCDRWVFLYAIRGGGVIQARVEPGERKAMRSLSTPAAVLEYLGILPTR